MCSQKLAVELVVAGVLVVAGALGADETAGVDGGVCADAAWLLPEESFEPQATLSVATTARRRTLA
ncbi:hypothetical protein [Microlunatus endophyticus]|uniref:hypothetical protein n=1 Tax=Microlunatus endophyticus TaxID=1716077 RepID=UPI00166DD66D|nr:hypothetical protein [Microlunatus endophyticus]